MTIHLWCVRGSCVEWRAAHKQPLFEERPAIDLGGRQIGSTTEIRSVRMRRRVLPVRWGHLQTIEPERTLRLYLTLHSRLHSNLLKQLVSSHSWTGIW